MTQFDHAPAAAAADHAHWLLRAALVGVFLYHGILTLNDLQGFMQMLSLSMTEVVLIALAQVGGSLLLMLGGLGQSRLFDVGTRVGAALNLPIMAGAITMVHWGRWNFVPTESHPLGGMEFQVVLALLMTYLVIVGNRPFANTSAHVSAARGANADLTAHTV